MAENTQGKHQQQLNKAQQIMEWGKCKADPIYFIRNYLWIYETRKEFGIGFKPFDLWPRQEEFILFLEQAYQENWKEVVCEKCRDMGGSLLALAWLLYHWLFDDDFTAIVGTLTEDKLKLKPGHDTLFAKLRDYLEQLEKHSPWLLPNGFDIDIHLQSRSLERPSLNTSTNKNTITGELGTEEFARSCRGGVVFRDELAFWGVDTSENAVRSASLSIDLSTVNGENYFTVNGDAADLYTPSRYFTFDWFHNLNFMVIPNWLEDDEKRAMRKGPEAHATWKREVLRSRSSGVSGKLYPFIDSCPKDQHYEYNPDWPLFTAADWGRSDPTVILWIQRNPLTGDLRLIDEYHNQGKSIGFYVPFYTGQYLIPSPHSYNEYEKEMIARHALWNEQGSKFKRRDFGDPTGNQTTIASDRSALDVLRENEVRISCGPGWQNKALRNETANTAMHRLSIDARCTYFIKSMNNYVSRPPGPNSTTTRESEGVHMWSHAPTAWEYFCLSEPPLHQDRDILNGKTRTALPQRGARWALAPWATR